MRRFLRFLLALTLVLGLCVPAARAAEAPEVSISSGTVAPGGDVTLTVSIRNNPGIATVEFYIYYDTSVFSFDLDEGIKAVGSFAPGMVVGNTLALARENGRVVGQANKEGLLFVWFNSSGMNAYGDGEIFTITLQASPTAVSGEYRLELEQDVQSISDEYGEIIPVTVSSGAITVTGNNTQPPADQGGDQNGQQGQNPEDDPSQGSEDPGRDEPDGGIPSETPAASFADTTGNWAEGFIQRASAQGLIQGYNGLYRPDDSMTRAELVTVLWRASGSPTGEAASFTDLTQDWYKDAVAWAERTGVVNGVGGGRFDPEGHVSREQLAAILHRMAGSPVGMEAMLYVVYDQQHVDSAAVSGWAKQSLYWAVYNEIYCGEADLSVGQTLAPREDASRAQIAVMMVRYLDKKY